VNASDRRYLSRFELDPVLEYRWEDLYELDFYDPEDEEIDPFDDENDMDVDDPIPDADIHLETKTANASRWK
jgi:hypothetical protein